MKRSSVVLVNVLALVMLVAVITSHLFQVPAFDETTQVTFIALACALTGISTWVGAQHKQANPQ